MVFGKKEGKRINWIKPYTKIKDVKYSNSDVKIKWFYDGTLNASANCIDRHLKKNKDKTAIIWVGDDPKVQKKISYKELHKEVSKAANGLKDGGSIPSGRPSTATTSSAEMPASSIIVVVGVTTEEPAGAFKTTSSKTSPDDVSIVVSSVCATKPTPDIVPDNVKEPSSAVLIDGSSEPSTPSPS